MQQMVLRRIQASSHLLTDQMETLLVDDLISATTRSLGEMHYEVKMCYYKFQTIHRVIDDVLTGR